MRNAYINAKIKPSTRFDSAGNFALYDSSNFAYNYFPQYFPPEPNDTVHNIAGIPFKQPRLKFTFQPKDSNSAAFSYVYKEAYLSGQWQFLINTSYRLAESPTSTRVGFNNGTGLQINTGTLNSRLATFYNISAKQGSFLSKLTFSLQLQQPLKKFSLK